MAKQVTDYLNLLTSQYRDKPKTISFLTTLLTPFLDIQKLNDSIKYMLNLNNSEGAQLDIIGEILNLPRQVNFQPTDGSSSVLDDYHYRLILKAKVAINQWKGTKSELYDYWKVLFPDNPLLMVDNQNMTISAVVVGLNSDLERDLIMHDYIIPRPAGVGMIYIFTDKPIYAQDLDTDWLKGFDEGYWFSFTGESK